MGPLIEFYGMLFLAVLAAVSVACFILGAIVALHRIYWWLTDQNTRIIMAQADQLNHEGDALANFRLYMLETTHFNGGPGDDYSDATQAHDPNPDDPPPSYWSRY